LPEPFEVRKRPEPPTSDDERTFLNLRATERDARASRRTARSHDSCVISRATLPANAVLQ
jgi:hypothetical protein